MDKTATKRQGEKKKRIDEKRKVVIDIYVSDCFSKCFLVENVSKQ